MTESKSNKVVTDEELIGVLTAIRVVSRRLARKLIRLNQTSQSQEVIKMNNPTKIEMSAEDFGYCPISYIASWITVAFDRKSKSFSSSKDY